MTLLIITQKIICIGTALATPFYLLLTIIALSSTTVPFLRDLAAHGKTRPARNAAGTGAVVGDYYYDRRNRLHRRRPLSLPLERFLNSDYLLVSKSRFLHFYVTGIAVTAALLLVVVVIPREVCEVVRDDDDGHRGPVLVGFVVVPRDLIVLPLLLTHLVRRCYECVHVHAESDGSMHVAGYALGVLHYAFLPLAFLPPPIMNPTTISGPIKSSGEEEGASSAAAVRRICWVC